MTFSLNVARRPRTSIVNALVNIFGVQALPELALFEQCGFESQDCLAHPRLASYVENIRNSIAADATTVILNYWRRPVANLQGQLRAAVASSAVEVWVCLFGAPSEAEYYEAVELIRNESSEALAKVRTIRSDVDFGVYGRFNLASMAKTRYVYIVDDDVAFPVTAIAQYTSHIRRSPGVWGHAGHVRSTDPDIARWVERPRTPVVVDYANAAWFLETSWLSIAFLREPPPSRLTGEDMHLSFMVRKILGLETRVVGWRRDKHSLSRYRLGMTEVTTLTPPMFSLRSVIARAQSARGPMMRSAPTFDLLAYVETGAQAVQLEHRLQHCTKMKSTKLSDDALCQMRQGDLLQSGVFRIAVFFSGLQSVREREIIEAAAMDICLKWSHPPCAYAPHEMCGTQCYELHVAQVRFFDMGVGQGVDPAVGVDSPLLSAHLAADALETGASLLTSLRPRRLLVPKQTSPMRRMILYATEFMETAPVVMEVSLDAGASE